jgi:hypothetical protein
VAHTHARIDWYKRLDPTTETGKELKAQIKKDHTFGESNVVALDTTANIRNLENMLAGSEFAQVESEWQRIRREKRGKISWYSLFDGPRNVENLAAVVGDSGWYQTFYRFYSAEAHASNALLSLHATHDGRGAYQPLRYPTDLPMVARLAINIILRTYGTLVDMLLPDEKQEYADWFAKEVKPGYDALVKFRIVDPSRPSGARPPKRP